ncbi:MAG: DUF3293 domain-containing protein [Alkalimonas sp.]|nr:DUF3293 domain-containing protein [Alkalimonas sp.]
MQLWQLYQQTIFLSHQPFSDQVSFAIISAANPMGRLCNQGFNLCMSKALAAELEQSPYRFRSITGASPCLTFQEASWAVFCQKEQARELAKQWQQNAMYWVEQGTLWLIPVLLAEEPLLLGDFQQRLRLR